MSTVDARGTAALTRTPLAGWTVRPLEPAAGWPQGTPDAVRDGLVLDAVVPGAVSVDLIAAGLASDITIDGSEDADAWIMRTGWEYRTTIAAAGPAPRRALIEFGGIDTIATVLVNGTARLSTSDMHRTYTLDVTDDLAAGDVELTVSIRSALEVAEPKDAANYLARPEAYVLPYNQVRKMACSYGWDWGPITGSAGLWQAVTLLTWDDARLDDVRVNAGFVGGSIEGTPILDVTALIDTAGGAADATGTQLQVSVAAVGAAPAVDATASTPATTTAATTDEQRPHAAVRLDVPGAGVWQPVGHGAQPLYDVTVALVRDGRTLDTVVKRVGFRTIELVQTPDEHGTSFELHVNGLRLWVRGLNWIPDDPYPTRIPRSQVETRVDQAVETGTNLLRVWGGGIFESEDFFDVCDERGVLVWQDFLFACAAYDEDDDTVADVRAEAADNIARLRHRASLAVWSGCNENLWGYEVWNWLPVLGDKPWGARYYADVLPSVVSEVDGTRPYVPGSPFSPGGQPYRADGPAAADEGHGTVHIWDVWNEIDYVHYEDKHPRFAAEFGYQAPASWPTLATAIGAPLDPAHPDSIQADDPRLAVHQKAENGDAKLRAGLERHFATAPATGLDWYHATQLLQARAVTTGIGHLRSLYELCSGTIWWQHNDMWPAISWSIVDVRGRRKLAWYAMREAYRPRTVVLGGVGAEVVATVINDGDDAWTAPLTLTVARADGEVLARVSRPVDVPARSASRVALADLDGVADTLTSADVVLADVEGVRVTRWLRPDLDLPATEAGLSVSTARAGAGVEVTVTAAGLARDVCLLAEVAAPDAVVDRQLVTLLPGESVTFTVAGEGVADVDPARWAGLVRHDGSLR